MSPPARGPPRVTVRIPEGREFSTLLDQTKIVYNRLLSDKYDKLLYSIISKKQEFDKKCEEMAKQDEDKALEFAVKAQHELIELQKEANQELGFLHQDYTNKLRKMRKQLEENMRKEIIVQPKANIVIHEKLSDKNVNTLNTTKQNGDPVKGIILNGIKSADKKRGKVVTICV